VLDAHRQAMGGKAKVKGAVFTHAPEGARVGPMTAAPGAAGRARFLVTY